MDNFTYRNQQETDYYGIPMNYNRKDTKSNGTYASLPPVYRKSRFKESPLQLVVVATTSCLKANFRIS